jgi:hypothetical protein
MASKTVKSEQADKVAASGDTPSCFVETHGIITSTMNDLPGYRVVKVLGTIYGITVRSRNWGADSTYWGSTFLPIRECLKRSYS